MNWIIKLFFEKLLEYIAGLFKREVESIKRTEDQKKRDSELLDVYKKAVESGDKTAIAKAAEDMLNGR
jgi:hypothetical protein